MKIICPRCERNLDPRKVNTKTLVYTCECGCERKLELSDIVSQLHEPMSKLFTDLQKAENILLNFTAEMGLTIARMILSTGKNHFSMDVLTAVSHNCINLAIEIMSHHGLATIVDGRFILSDKAIELATDEEDDYECE